MTGRIVSVRRVFLFRGPVFAKKSSAATIRRDSFEPPTPNKGKVGRIHDSAMDAFALLFFARFNPPYTVVANFAFRGEGGSMQLCRIYAALLFLQTPESILDRTADCIADCCVDRAANPNLSESRR